MDEEFQHMDTERARRKKKKKKKKSALAEIDLAIKKTFYWFEIIY